MTDLARFDFTSLIPPLGTYPCGGIPKGSCSATIERPGFCPRCMAAHEQTERAAKIRSALRREIPGRFQSARWGSDELAAHVHGGAKRCEQARKALSGARAVLVGGAGTGKTSLVCAWLREQIEAGVERARFVAAHDLTSTQSYLEGVSRLDLAISATVLVVDDLGEEFTGAPPGSGLAAQRAEAMVRLVRTRHDQGLPMVVTTGREVEDRMVGGVRVPGIASLYGDGIARRLFESVPTVRLG